MPCGSISEEMPSPVKVVAACYPTIFPCSCGGWTHASDCVDDNHACLATWYLFSSCCIKIFLDVASGMPGVYFFFNVFFLSIKHKRRHTASIFYKIFFFILVQFLRFIFLWRCSTFFFFIL